MADNYDQLALSWVREEVNKTLDQARQSLEAFAENPQDVTQMRFCVNCLHQVHGTLQMLEFEGAARLAQELELLADALGTERVRDPQVAQEALMTGILQLPNYLERVQAGQKDMPVILLPQLNEARAARGEQPLDEQAVFAPAISGVQPPRPSQTSDAPRSAEEMQATAKKLRNHYQKGLLDLIKGQNVKEGVQRMHKVLERLELYTASEPVGHLWWVADGFLIAIAEGGLYKNQSVQTLLGRIDRQIKRLADDGIEAVRDEIPQELLKNLLYFVAKSNSQNKRVVELKREFKLEATLPDDQRLQQVRAQSGGMNQQTIATVVGALTEDLNSVKDQLDLYVRSKEKSSDQLQTLVPALQKISDTLSMLSLDIPRQVVSEQINKLSKLLGEGGAPDDGNVMDIAGALLFVEANLSGLASQAAAARAGEEDQTEHALPATGRREFDSARQSLLKECRTNLQRAKDAIIDYMASGWNTPLLEGVPEQLAEVKGGLDIVGLDQPSAMVQRCAIFIKDGLLTGHKQPSDKTLDAMADVLTSIEYYLDGLLDSTSIPLASVLEAAQPSLEALQLDEIQTPSTDTQPQAAAPDTATPPAAKPTAIEQPAASPPESTPVAQAPTFEHDDSLIDDEVIEIFLEEAQEELESIDTLLPKWIDDPKDEESLLTLRRSFHTLKGSGRLVGAELVGELAWAIENMLNRVIDNTIEVSQSVGTTVAQAKALLPDLIDAFAKQGQPARTPDAVIANAQALSRGEAIDTSLVETAAQEPAQPQVTEQPRAVESEAATEPEQTEQQQQALGDTGLELEQPAEEALEELQLEQHEDELTLEFVDEPDTSGQEESEPEMLPRVEDEPLPLAETTVEQEEQLPTEATLDAAMEEQQQFEPEGFKQQEPAYDELDEDAIDPVLCEIFVNETESHLVGLQEFIQESRDQIGSRISEALIRSLHTIKGSAKTAGIETIARLVAPLESLCRDWLNRDKSCDDDLLEVLAQAENLLANHLADLRGGQLPAEELNEPLFEKIAQLHAGLKGAQEVAVDDERDPELMSIFLAEGMDILAAADQALAQWRGDPHDLSVQHNAQSEMHTLKRGAAMAKLPAIEQLASELERFYQRAEHEPLNDRYFDLASSAQQQLEQMLNHVAASQPVSEQPELLRALQQWQPDISSEDSVEDIPTIELEELSSVEGDTDAFIEAVSEEPVLDDEQVESVEELALTDVAPEEFSVEAEAEAEAEAVPVTPMAPVQPVVAGEAPEELDPELVELFTEEADEILELTTELVAHWRDAPHNTELMADLQRHLHTLKGSARMAGLASIGNLGHALEDIYQAVAEGQQSVNDALINLAERAHDHLADMVAMARTMQYPAEAEQLIQQIRQFPEGAAAATDSAAAPKDTATGRATAETAPSYHETHVSSAGEVFEKGETLPVEIDDEDLDVLEIYLEEAEDLMGELDTAVVQWSASPQDKEQISLIQRLMHTLKGGARLAGLTVLGDLTHQLESLFESIGDGEITPDAGVVNLAQQGFDETIALIEEIRDQRTMTEPLGYNQKLSAVLEGGELPVEAEGESEAAPEAAAPAEAGAVVSFSAEKQRRDQARVDQAKQTQAAPQTQEVVRVPSNLLETLVNLAGETSIFRARLEQQVSGVRYNLTEMTATVERLREQLRNLEIETEAQIVYRMEVIGQEYDEFDPLEMDRYTRQQELARSLGESASDLLNLRDTLDTIAVDSETLLLQQSRVNTELQERLIRTRMVPFESLVPRLRRIVRQIGAELNKQVELSIVAEGEMDRTVLERMVAPLEHMLRNAMDHGIEPIEQRKAVGKPEVGRIKIRLIRQGGEVVIELEDDGRGINLEAVRKKAIERGLITEQSQLTDHELRQLILEAGFSTAQQVTQISGRGVGMDVVSSEIRQLGGVIEIHSEQGKGTTFTVRLPFTVSMNQALMVAIGDDLYAIPLANIEGIVRVSPYELEEYYKNPEASFEYAGLPYRMKYLGQLLDHNAEANLSGSRPLPVLLLHGVEHPIALQVDELLGSREIVVKSVGQQLSTISGLSGATILGDGRVVLILDMPALLRREDAILPTDVVEEEVQLEEEQQHTVMVVDDSITVRKVTARLLERHDYQVVTAKDGVDAVNVLHEQVPDVMLLDIEMPRMDGFELATIIRHDERLKHIPIIMITSRTGEKHRERAESIGVNRYMGKPFNEVDLIRGIEELISEKDSR